MAAYDPSGLPDMSGEQPPPHTNGDYSYDQEEAGDEDDDYDPSSFNFGDSADQPLAQDAQFDPAPMPTEQQPQEQAPKAKTVGGFIIEESDDSDEEEDTSMSGVSPPQPSQLNGGAEGTAVHEAVSASASAGEDVHIASEPTQDSASAAQQLHDNSLTGSTTATATATATTSPHPTTLPVPITTAADVVDASAASSAAAAAVPVPSAQAASTSADQGKRAAYSPTPAAAVSVSATPKPMVNGIAALPEGNAVPPTPTTQRLPHDKVGRLEDRIKGDPKADVEAWWELIQHYRDKDQLDNARRVFDRMLEVWPTSPTIYLAYLDLETTHFSRARIDPLFGASLPAIPSLPLWSAYLAYLRRVFPLIPDPAGTNRTTITSAFEHVLDAVGTDPDSQNLWRDYIDFVNSGPGVLGGSGWQDLQKVDLARKAYQQAVKVPNGGVVALWKEYDGFEMSQSKTAGRKVLQEMSPHYMTARTAEKQLQGVIEGLDRRAGVPSLPPVEGCEGDDAFAGQVQRWRGWVEWEKSDPLVLREEDVALYRKRILFVYKQATIFLRFWPRIWYEAAQWCFEQVGSGAEDINAQGEAFLDEGLRANPESVLLTLQKADRLEEGMQTGNVRDEVTIVNGEKLEAVFEPCHKALYELVKKMGERRDKAVGEVRAYFASLRPEEEEEGGEDAAKDDDDEDAEGEAEDSPVEKPKTRAELLQDRIKAVQDAAKAQQKVLSKTISYLWIAKMRAFRRVQGQGAPSKPKKGFRGVFAEARPRGQLSADVYVASALMEHHCYKDASALKIFERGLKLFPMDEEFALAYVRHLIHVNDLVNARVVFETTVTKILGAGKGFGEQERREKVRGLVEFMHGFEASYGDLSQVGKLENRMRELYPDEPESRRFSERFLMQGFDGMGVQLVLSPSQIKPKRVQTITMPDGGVVPMPMPMPDGAAGFGGPGLLVPAESGLRLGPNEPYIASPKRPLEDDTDGEGPRKFARGESPLKGVRRGQPGHTTSTSISASGANPADANAANAANAGGGGGGGFMTKNFVPGTSSTLPTNVGPPALPNQVSLLLQVLPNAASYQAVVFDAGRMVNLLRGLEVEGKRERIVGGGAAGQQGNGYA